MFFRNFIFFIFYFISNLSYSNDNNQLLLHESPKKNEEIFLLTLSDKTEKLEKNKKSVTIINFWATWCPPCIKEIPQLIEIKTMYPDQVNLIFVSMDLNANVVIPRFLKKNNLSFEKIYKDSSMKLSEQLNVKILPTTLFLNKNLDEIAKIEGLIDWFEKENLDFLKKILEIT